MRTDLLKCVKDLFMNEGLLEEIKGFLSDVQRVSNTGSAEQREALWTRVEAWRKRYLIRFDTVNIYGYLTWYLDISVGEFHFPSDHDFKDSLLKMLIISLLSNAGNMSFDDEASLMEYLENEHDEWAECHSVTSLSQNMFIEDLERFYAGSNRRLQNHMKKYDGHADLNRRLIEADEKYLKYITCARSCSEIEQIVRVNNLGMCENGNSYRTENALYIILSSQSSYLLTFSDFA